MGLPHPICHDTIEPFFAGHIRLHARPPPPLPKSGNELEALEPILRIKLQSADARPLPRRYGIRSLQCVILFQHQFRRRSIKIPTTFPRLIMKLSKLVHILIAPAMIAVLAGCGSTISESIGGTVTGLSGGTQLILVNNGGDPVTVSANGSFTFSQQVQSGSAYNVTVQSNPIGETCTVSNGTGSISSTIGAVTNISVSCTAITSNYNSVSGTVSGLPTNTSVTLSDGGSNPSSVTVTTNGSFSFPTELPIGSSYNVTVTASPTVGSCTVTNASGAVPAIGGTTSVTVTCN